MNTSPLDVIVVGAGYAGLSASYFLKQHGLSHLILERGSIGESWASQRWDSFRLNTANKLNALPGCELETHQPDEFESASSLVKWMNQYVRTHDLPVLTHATVTRIDKDPGSTLFRVQTKQNGQAVTYASRQVIIASGAQSKKQPSVLADKIDPAITQLHSSDYRNAQALPPGAVLIVGSAQSGCQIAEDLIQAGRTVYLSTSKVPRCPRYYRGKDIMDWLIETGFFDARSEEIADAALLHLKTPLLKGTDGGRQTLSLQRLAQQGVILLGKLQEATSDTAFFSADTLAHVNFGDGFSQRVKSLIDTFITANQLTAPAPELDPADEPDPAIDVSETARSIQLKSAGITSLIWATGFTADLGYIELPVFDDDGNPILHQGMSTVDGFYFLGLPWLRSRKSSILFGIKDDARYITDRINAVAAHQANASRQSE